MKTLSYPEFNEAYNRGYNDALQWVVDHTDGDNYKQQVMRHLNNK